MPIEDLEAFIRRGLALFPATRYPPDARFVGSHFMNPAPRSPRIGPLAEFLIWTPLHTSFPADWPIQVDIPMALKGFRAAIGLSQAKLAGKLGMSRVNIERWEAGASRPFKGDTLSLLDLLRPLTEGKVAAGQLLNLAAAIVCPPMKRPTATYSGREIAQPLRGRSHDHRDLAPAVISALTTSQILTCIDPEEDELDALYVPLAGVHAIDHDLEPWEHEVHGLARKLTPEDRLLWVSIGKRLAHGDKGVQPKRGE